MSGKALIVGFFSTIGDIECLEFVRGEVARVGLAFDVAAYSDKIAGELPGALRARAGRPGDYTHLIVVCGPFWPGLFERHGLKLGEFGHCFRIGLNLTMIEPVAGWNPFDLLIERDSDRQARPDLTFAWETGSTPVAGVCVIERQKEYGARQRHEETIAAFDRLAERRRLATVAIDTRWPRSRNSGGLGSPEQIASLMRRMDVVLTNRLHGLVFALKSGVPALAVDSVDGGGKVSAQARVLGWPACALSKDATDAWLEEMLEWCLKPEARERAAACAQLGRSVGDEVRAELERALREPFTATQPPREPAPRQSLFSALRLRR